MMMASASVFRTSRIESRTATVGLKAMLYSSEGGNWRDSFSSVARARASMSRALASGS
jgi:hypothetical protein